MRIYQILSSNFLRKRTEISLEYWGFSRVIIVSVFYTSDIRSRFITITAGNLSKDVFERRTSTGSEAFFLFICLDAIKFSLLNFFSLLKTIYPRVLTKPLPNDAKSPLPVDVRPSKTLLLKLPSVFERRTSTGSGLFASLGGGLVETLG